MSELAHVRRGVVVWNQMRKPVRRVAVRGMIALVAASLFAATATQQVLPLTKQRSYNVMQVAQIDEAPSTIGVSDSDLYFSKSLEEINARLDLMQSLGVTNVRILVPWANVQPLHPSTPFGLGAPRWDQLDMVVNAAAARGMGILGVLNSTPLWATNTTPINGLPTNFDQFASFAKSVALRYGDKISAYEVWNEPNSVQFWNSLNPTAYTEMLKVTYTALKSAAAQLGTNITVIGGVVGAGMSMNGLTMNPVDFVRKMYEAGANGYFDALSFHSYNLTWKFSSGQGLPWHEAPLAQLNKIRALMDSYLTEGQEQLKIWMTEYGLPTNVVSETTQAAFVEDMIKFWQNVSGAGPVFLYTIKDWLNGAANNNEAHFGIFRPDGTMKPVGQIIKDLIALLSKPTTPGTGNPGTNPGTPAVNPVSAILKAITQAFNSFGTAFSKLLSGLFGKKPATAARTTVVSARLAAASAEDVAQSDETAVEGVATDPEKVVETDSGAGESTTEVTSPLDGETVSNETVVTEELPATEGVPAEVSVEGEVTEGLPTEEVTPAEGEVTEQLPAEEITQSEGEVAEPAGTEVRNVESLDDKVTNDKVTNDKVTDDTEAADSAAPEKKATTSVDGKRELAASDSTETADREARKVAVPSLKARHELRSPRGPRTAVRSGSESKQDAPSSEREGSDAKTTSGGDD